MNINKNIRIAVIVGLLMVVGVSAALLLGFQMGDMNASDSTDQGMMQKNTQDQAALEAAAEVNPFAEGSLETSPVNPFDEVETNPYNQ